MHTYLFYTPFDYCRTHIAHLLFPLICDSPRESMSTFSWSGPLPGFGGSLIASNIAGYPFKLYMCYLRICAVFVFIALSHILLLNGFFPLVKWNECLECGGGGMDGGNNGSKRYASAKRLHILVKQKTHYYTIHKHAHPHMRPRFVKCVPPQRCLRSFDFEFAFKWNAENVCGLGVGGTLALFGARRVVNRDCDGRTR